MNWYFADIGTVSCKTAWALQNKILDAKKEDAAFPDIVLFLEHTPVFTLGRSARTENLKVSESFAEKAGIEIARTDRGGDITYHGPGQIIGYPVVNLGQNRLKVLEYVEKLEETMIQTARAWKIEAERSRLNRGAWVHGRKLGSIGISVKKEIALHGFALNVDLSLAPYEWINPCGLENITMTTMARETALDVPIPRVKEELIRQMTGIFNVTKRVLDENEIHRFWEDLYKNGYRK